MLQAGLRVTSTLVKFISRSRSDEWNLFVLAASGALTLTEYASTVSGEDDYHKCFIWYQIRQI